MARLEIDIEANVSGLSKSISQATAVAAKLSSPFQGTIGVVNLLNQRASILKKSLDSATDIKSIASYNRRLKETQEEIAKVKSTGLNTTSEIKIDSRQVLRLSKELENARKKLIDLQKVPDPISPKFVKATSIIQGVQQKISNLRNNLENATDIKSVVKYNIRLEEAQRELKRLGDLGLQSGAKISNALNRTSNSMGGLSRSTHTYNGIGIEFSRIIQDAPFGLMGIGNNIQQLAGNFQNLRAKSTSTGAALKTAFASIVSPTNLLVLGISVLTSALTYLSMKGFFKSKESAEDAEEALEKYRKTLSAVSQANIEGASSAQKEIQSFKLLTAQAENTNVPLAKRIEAVKDLQKEYPEYLGNLSQEQILTGDVGSAYDNLTNSLIATAKARAASDKIAQNSLELLTLETKKADLETKKLTEDQIKAIKETKGLVTGVSGIGDKLNKQLIARSKNLKISEEQLGIETRVKEIKKEDESLTKSITEQINKGANFTQTVLEKTEALKRVREDLAKLPIADTRDLDAKMQSSFEADMTVSSGKTSTKGIIQPESLLPTKQSFSEYTKGLMKSYGEVLDEEIPTFQEKVFNLMSSVNDLMKVSTAEAFTDFGTAIGEALANGGNVIQAMGSSILSSFASFLGDFGKRLILYGVATIAFGKASEGLTNPLTAGPSGILAIAAGVALTAISGVIGGIGKKGMGSGGGSSGSSGVGSMSYTGSGLETNTSNALVAEYTIRGTDLVTVIRNQEKKDNRG